MKLHGKTDIYFYDKDGNLLSKTTKKNSVTQAVKNLLNPNFAVDVFNNSDGNLGTNLTPLWRLFGGLLVFNKNNNVGEYVPQKQHFDNFTGQAGGSYSGSNPYRGTFLSSESSITDKECDLWFEFDLEKCTGNIKSFSLTSIAGGANGLCKLNDNSSTSFFTAYGQENPGNEKTYAAVGNNEGGGISSCCFVPYVLKDIDGVMVGNNNKEYITTKVDGTNITIKKFKYGSNLGFNNTVRQVENLSDYIDNFGGSLEGLGLITKTLDATVSSNLSFCDEYHLVVRNNKIWSCTFNNGNFYLISIDYTDDNLVVQYGIAETQIENINECRCDGNKIYATDDNWLYVIEMPDLLDVQSPTSCSYCKVELLEKGTPIPYRDTVAIVNNDAIDGEVERNIYFLNSNNILCKNGIIMNNTCDCPVFGFVDLGDPVIGILSKTTTEGYETTSVNANVVPYLATVNNLTSELWKYATTTMKVHYNLTME